MAAQHSRLSLKRIPRSTSPGEPKNHLGPIILPPPTPDASHKWRFMVYRDSLLKMEESWPGDCFCVGVVLLLLNYWLYEKNWSFPSTFRGADGMVTPCFWCSKPHEVRWFFIGFQSRQTIGCDLENWDQEVIVGYGNIQKESEIVSRNPQTSMKSLVISTFAALAATNMNF